MSLQDQAYAFLSRGLLARASLDKVLRSEPHGGTQTAAEIEARLSVPLLDEDMVAAAQRMAAVYTAIAAFENSVRELVWKRLLEEKGENWWIESVSDKIRTKAEQRKKEEEKIRWHTPRGEALINYTEFGDLASIISQHWSIFESLLPSQDWVRNIIETLERSRNVIMHSGDLAYPDIERIGVVIRDWVTQVGT